MPARLHPKLASEMNASTEMSAPGLDARESHRRLTEICISDNRASEGQQMTINHCQYSQEQTAIAFD
ncbi:hypothetical protein F2P47_04930 [Parvibaculum sedimenti]|uniref:Uncharacterized protein n=1 Tax=Parvibaculum sedimenti TaxID=2608632 RepID=A0A6N6VPB3_9HYPH|nr:hypothetical protein [Parvibaculum sedimenti]KAB7741750.1 hypothetical protein F2P47_04930 [Parvibaculum sedimenti]